MADCNSTVVGLYTSQYWCPRKLEYCDARNMKTMIPGPIPTYVSLVSSSLSVVGSILIVYSYWRWKDIRTTSRSIITYIAIADFFTAAGYIVAAGNYLIHYGGYDASVGCLRFQQVCEMQSFITTWSTLSSFVWTSYLAIYLYLTIVHNRICLAQRLIPLVHVAAWVLPFTIVYPLLLKRRLGYSMVASSNWCYIQDKHQQGIIKSREHVSWDTVLLALVAGELCIFIMYVVVIVFYGLIKWHIRKEVLCVIFIWHCVKCYYMIYI